MTTPYKTKFLRWFWPILNSILLSLGSAFASTVSVIIVGDHQTYNFASAYGTGLIGKQFLAAFLFTFAPVFLAYIQKNPFPEPDALEEPPTGGPKGILPLFIAGLCLGLLTSCATVGEWWQRPGTQRAARAALLFAETEALNLGANALQQYVGTGKVNFATASLSAAPIALRTLESTSQADSATAIQSTLNAWLADPAQRTLSPGVSSLIETAILKGATPDAALEAVANGLDRAIADATTPLPSDGGKAFAPPSF